VTDLRPSRNEENLHIKIMFLNYMVRFVNDSLKLKRLGSVKNLDDIQTIPGDELALW